MTQKEFEKKLAEQEIQEKEEQKEKINLHDIQSTLQGLSDRLQGINFLLKNNSLYILVDSELDDFKTRLKDNFTYLHYLTEVEHAFIYLDFGLNKVRITSSDLNKLTDF